jgi:excisionase family DNA binding protein
MMKAIDAGLQASPHQPSEDVQSQSEPAGQGDRAPSCRTILPKQQRSEQLQKSSGHSTRPRRSQAASKHPSMGADHSTLIEYLEAFGKGMRARQLAALLSVGRSTLYEWADAGTIPCYKHRGVVFFDPAIIAIWLRQQEVMN